MTDGSVGELVADLLQAAVRTDGKGQLNVSKILRASATAIAQRAAAEKGFPDDRETLARDVLALSQRLVKSGIDTAVSERIALGADLIGRGEQTYLDRFPDPYVCRRCGHITGDIPPSHCPTCGAHGLTFQRFGPVYWLRLYDPHEVLERLTANPALFREAIARIPKDRLSWKPRPNAWAAVDVLRHVRDADAVLSQRIALILSEVDPPLEFKPVFAWADEGLSEGESVETVMHAFVTSRDATVTRLREMGPDGWRRTGVHEEFGRVTLTEQASYFAAHELTHLRQLEELRRTLAEK